MEETNVAMITSMGFTQNAALRGLRRGGGDVERAVEWIMAHVDDADLNDPLPQSVHDPPSQPQVDGGGDEWEVVVDPASGRPYLYNRRTEESRWDESEDRPATGDGFSAWLARREAGRGRGGGGRQAVRLASDDDPSVLMILEMGFSVNAAKKALHFCRGDAARAVEWIMVRVGTPDLDEEFDPNYDPSDSLVDSIRDMAPNLEERLESLNTEVLMSSGGEGGASPLENPKSQMKIAAALLSMLERCRTEQTTRSPVLAEWACRTLSNFRDRGNREFDLFLQDEKTLLVLLSIVEPGPTSDRRVNEEVMGVLGSLSKAQSSARRAILQAGGLELVLAVAAAEASAVSSVLTEQALAVATDLVRSLRLDVHGVAAIPACLCSLLASPEQKIRQKTLELTCALFTIYNGATDPIMALLEASARSLPRFLLNSVRDDTATCVAACDLLSLMCGANGASLHLLMDEGLFDVVASSVTTCKTSSIASVCLLIKAVVFVTYSSGGQNVSVGDQVDVLTDESNRDEATESLCGPIFPDGKPHVQITTAARVSHTSLGDGKLLGWKYDGDRTGDTSGGLQSDGYCRILFDSGKGNNGWNVPAGEVSFSSGPAWTRGTVVADLFDGTYVVDWHRACELDVCVKAKHVKPCTVVLGKGAKVRAKKRPLGFANFSGGSDYYPATVISTDARDTVHVAYDDEERDDPELPVKLLEPGSFLNKPQAAQVSFELNADVIEERNTFVRTLLIRLVQKLREPSQNPKILLETTVLLADKLCDSSLSQDASRELVTLISETVQHVFTDRNSSGSLLFAVRLGTAALRLQPSVSAGILTRYGIVDSVRKMSRGELKLTRTVSRDVSDKVLISTSAHLLAAMESAAEAENCDSASSSSALQVLAARLTACDWSAATDLANLLKSADGITQFEFENAKLVQALLKFATKHDGVSCLRNALDSECWIRCVDLLNGILSNHDELPVCASNVTISDAVRPLKIRFGKKTAQSACDDIAETISVDAIVKTAQLETWILLRSQCNHPKYVQYCKDIVGCRIEIMSAFSLARTVEPNEWHRADVVSFDESTGRHLLLIGQDSTSLSLSLQAVAHRCIRGAFVSPDTDLAALSAALFRMTSQAASKQVLALPMLVNRLGKLGAAPADSPLRDLQKSDSFVQDILALPGGEQVITAVGFKATEDGFTCGRVTPEELAACTNQLLWSLQCIPDQASLKPEVAAEGHQYTPFGEDGYTKCLRCGMLGPSTQSGPDYCKRCLCCRVCCSKQESCPADVAEMCTLSDIEVAFDRDRCGSSVQISEDDARTVSFDGHSTVLLSHTLRDHSGTWAIDILCLAGGNALVGVASESYDTNTYLGDSEGGCGVFARGGVRVDHAWERVSFAPSSSSDKGFKEGDVLRVEIDTDEASVLISKNGILVHEDDAPPLARFALGGSSGGKFKVLSTHLLQVANMDVMELNAGEKVACLSGFEWLPGTLLYRDPALSSGESGTEFIPVVVDGCREPLSIHREQIRGLASSKQRTHLATQYTGTDLSRQWSALDTNPGEGQERAVTHSSRFGRAGSPVTPEKDLQSVLLEPEPESQPAPELELGVGVQAPLTGLRTPAAVESAAITISLDTMPIPVQPYLQVSLEMADVGSSTVLSGSSVAVTQSNARVGMRVVRGPDWKWKEQDKFGVGVVTKPAKGGWISVKWAHGRTNSYRCTDEGPHDLRVAAPAAQGMGGWAVTDSSDRTANNCERERTAEEHMARFGGFLPTPVPPGDFGGPTGVFDSPPPRMLGSPLNPSAIVPSPGVSSATTPSGADPSDELQSVSPIMPTDHDVPAMHATELPTGSVEAPKVPPESEPEPEPELVDEQPEPESANERQSTKLEETSSEEGVPPPASTVLTPDMTLFQGLLKLKSGVEGQRTMMRSSYMVKFDITVKNEGGDRVVRADTASNFSNLAEVKGGDKPQPQQELLESLSPRSLQPAPTLEMGHNFLTNDAPLGELCGNDAVFLQTISLLAILHRDRTILSQVPSSTWVNTRLTTKLQNQLGDAVAVVSGSLPPWCRALTRAARFIFSFSVRYALLECSFGASRTIYRLQQAVAAGGGAGPAAEGVAHPLQRGRPSGRIGAIIKERVTMAREPFLPNAEALIAEYASKRTVLEVELGGAGEKGTGEGVHAEFYTCCAGSLMNRAHNARIPMWIPDSPPAIGTDHLQNPIGLFPAVLPESAQEPIVQEICQRFCFLGRLFGKAILDSRIIPMPLHPLFIDAVLGRRPAGFESLRAITSANSPGGTIILNCITIHAALEAAAGEDPAIAAQKLGDLPLGEVCAEFTTGGAGDMRVSEYLSYQTWENPSHVTTVAADAELVAGGADKELTVDGLADFLALVEAAWFGHGIARQLSAFRDGLQEVLPVEELLAFTGSELVELVCGDPVQWNAAELAEFLRPGYRFTAESKQLVWLREILLDMSSTERAAFVQFVTSVPRLPHGGLKALGHGGITVDMSTTVGRSYLPPVSPPPPPPPLPTAVTVAACCVQN